MKKWIMVLVVYLVAMSTWAAVTEYAVYDGKSIYNVVNATPPATIVSGNDNKILVVNKGNNKAVIVSWTAVSSSVETNVDVTYSQYLISTKTRGNSIASKDVVSMTLAETTVLLGSFESKTSLKDSSVQISESLEGRSIDGTPMQESYTNVTLKYNQNTSDEVNGPGGQVALNDYIAKKTKGAVTGVTLP